MTDWVMYIGGALAYLFIGGATCAALEESDHVLGPVDDTDKRLITMFWPLTVVVLGGMAGFYLSTTIGRLPVKAYRALRASYAQVDQLPEARVVEREKP